ncbi:MAG: DNA repair protein RecO [bacterium]
MALSKTEAVVLKSFNWSESSRTVVFFTPGYGKLALVDKGGRSMKSRRGRLLPFALLELTFYSSQKETSGYISDVELIAELTFEGDGSLGRLAYGSAACELLYVLAPEEEPLRDLYDYFVSYLKLVDAVDKRSLPGLFLAFLLRTMAHLGYHPSLSNCVVCGKDILPTDIDPDTPTDQSEAVAVSVERGGVVCEACQSPGDYYIHLAPRGIYLLRELQQASLREAATVPVGFRRASMVLEVLTKLLSFQSGLKGELKSLEFLQKLRQQTLTE